MNRRNFLASAAAAALTALAVHGLARLPPAVVNEEKRSRHVLYISVSPGRLSSDFRVLIDGEPYRVAPIVEHDDGESLYEVIGFPQDEIEARGWAGVTYGHFRA